MKGLITGILVLLFMVGGGASALDYIEEAFWFPQFTEIADNFWDVEHRGDILPNGASALSFRGAFLRPLQSSWYTSRAMEPRDLEGSEIHRGPDIQSSTRPSNVYCPLSGTVSYIQDKTVDSYGKYIVISHNDGSGNVIYTRYAHLEEIYVSLNDPTVTRGQIIGKTGNTGQGSGYHLHFEIYSKYNGATYYLYPTAYFLGTSGSPDYVGRPTVSGRTISVSISVYYENTPFSIVELIYRDRNNPSNWYTVDMSTIDDDSQTTRTFTWTRQSSLDDKTLDLYIVGRYNRTTYDKYVATRPAGSFILSSASAPLGIEANPGRYYGWRYPYPIIEPDKDENIVFLHSAK